MPRVLITGGAGFIGSHLADHLLETGYDVRVLDCLSPQVHGGDRARPAYLAKHVDLVDGDIRDPVAVARAVEGVDSVFHFAAAVGVGQSMYQIADYVGINDLGTAVLLEALMAHPVERLIVASSMSIYGEGLASTQDGRLVDPGERDPRQLERGQWDPRGPDGQPLEPVPTPETKQPSLSSVYALNKFSQERLCLIFGRAYGVPTTALRFFNVYGTRQALSNPYTGVLAIFASRLANGRAPLIFEDGEQRRDFVHVRDVARACRAALETKDRAFNVGSGVSRSIKDIAVELARAVGRPDLRPQITGRHRKGDIRHCFADISLAREILRFEPREDFQAGLVELAEWLAGETATDRVDQATDELVRRGLVA
jgi:dTDP-L-rhamnose 4-epimerase